MICSTCSRTYVSLRISHYRVHCHITESIIQNVSLYIDEKWQRVGNKRHNPRKPGPLASSTPRPSENQYACLTIDDDTEDDNDTEDDDDVALDDSDNGSLDFATLVRRVT